MKYNWETRLWDIRDPRDISFPLRRAFLLSAFLGARKEVLQIDRDLLRAFLQVPRYRHGSRSVEKIAKPLANTRLPYRRAFLSPPQVLRQHLETLEDFDAVYHQNRDFLCDENVRTIAAAIANFFYITYVEPGLKRTAEEAQAAFDKLAARSDPWDQWEVATNIAAARRLPWVLSLVSLGLQRGQTSETEKQEISNHLDRHLQRLDREEHNLWMDFHFGNGWRQADKQKLGELEKLKMKDKPAYKGETKRLKREERIHTLLRPFDELPEDEKNKDHDAIKNYPGTVGLVGWKIIFLDQ